MWLPGNKAKTKRSDFVNVIQRYLAGDSALAAEIDSNAKSNHPIAQMFRASLGTSAVSIDDDEYSKNHMRQI